MWLQASSVPEKVLYIKTLVTEMCNKYNIIISKIKSFLSVVFLLEWIKSVKK